MVLFYTLYKYRLIVTSSFYPILSCVGTRPRSHRNTPQSQGSNLSLLAPGSVCSTIIRGYHLEKLMKWTLLREFYKDRVSFAFYNSGIAHYSILSHFVLELNFHLHIGCFPLFEKQGQHCQQSLLQWFMVAGLAFSSTSQLVSQQAGAGPAGGLPGNVWLFSLSFVVSPHFQYIHVLSWSHL